MQFTPLQMLIAVSWLVFFLFAIDSFQRKSFNALHFLVFFGWSAVILVFTLDIWLLNRLWSFFWLNRWADLLVYISIIMLAYFYFELLNKVTRQGINTTRIITEQAISKALSHWELNTLTEAAWKKSEFIFLLRAYNEEKTIKEVVQSIIEAGYCKILIVNDWSSDWTAQAVSELKRDNRDRTILFISHLINRWWWAANKTWFEFIKRYANEINAKWLVTFDADWQMDIWDMKIFEKEISENGKVCAFIWSRFIKWWSASMMPPLRKVVLYWSRFITYILNWLWITDPHNWFRVLNVDMLQKIKIQSDWMAYASELLDEIHRNAILYKEVPVNIKYTDYSISKWQKNSNAFRILLELIYKKFFFK